MSNPLRPSRTAEQFQLRLPDGMRDRLAEAAKAAGRSVNAEIVVRLQQSFEAAKGAADPVREQHLLQVLMRRTLVMADLQAQRLDVEILHLKLRQASTDQEREALQAEMADAQTKLAQLTRELHHLTVELHKADESAKTTT